MQDILRSFGITEADFLGEGGETRAYRLDNKRVIRIFKQPSSEADFAELQHFYDGLNREAVLFAVPKILEYGSRHGYAYTIDALIEGQEFGKALATLSGEARTRALTSFWEVSKQLPKLAGEYDFFGEILGKTPIRATSWPEFLCQKTLHVYEQTKETLQAGIPNIDEIMTFFQAECSIVADVQGRTLVHGDYFPSNVFLGEAGTITGVADFTTLTLAGDPRMDVTDVVIFMEVVTTATAEDQTLLLAKAVERYGEGIKRIIHLYRLYYSFVFSDCKESDPITYAWCLANFRQHLAGKR